MKRRKEKQKTIGKEENHKRNEEQTTINKK